MKSKEVVKNGLLSLSKINNDQIGVTTIELANSLDLKRNHVSHLLNRLVEDEIAYKTNTRPVYYIHKDVIFKKSKKTQKKYGLKIKEEVQNFDNPFKSLVGYDGSLKSAIDQCKSAVLYPPNGLPILICGKSGVGKSYLAELIYKFTKVNKKIENDGNFLIFNCSEYADNTELVSSAIFGHKKGAFTGATDDKKGLLEQADGGVLFLDEIHRLTPESQEKLFIFLDKGIYRPLGDSSEWKKSNVRLIFATTKDPKKTFLKTFLRRIPLIINIPTFYNRPVKEKINLIRFFFWKESQKIKKDINVSSSVMKVLLETKIEGNVGKLRNTICLSCANAYSQINKKEYIKVDLESIPNEYLKKYDEIIFNGHTCENYNVKPSFTMKKVIMPYDKSEIYYLTKKIIKYKDEKISWDGYLKRIYPLLNDVIEKIMFNDNKGKKSRPLLETIKEIIKYAFKGFKNNYGIYYQGSNIEVISYMVDFLKSKNFKNLDESLSEIIKDFKKFENRSYKIACNLIDLLQKNLEYEISKITKFYLILYFQYLLRNIKEHNNAIIIAHGYATASSIASVANRLLDSYIYDAIDMPLNMTIAEIGNKLNDYIERINNNKDLIILVDMGSLEKIYTEIKDEYLGSIGIINNISTQLALQIGNSIKNEKNIEDIVNTIDSNSSVIKTNFFESDLPKTKTILITCNTGIGTAEKIRDLVKTCFKNENIKVVSYEYYSILEKQMDAEIFKSNDVRIILGTTDPRIDEIPFLSIEEIIYDKNNNLLNEYLKDLVSDKAINKINDKIVNLFTLENVLNNVSILNPKKITSQVKIALNNLERRLKFKLSNKHRISLTIHICCMVERLVIKNPIENYKTEKKFDKNHKSFIDLIRESFAVIEREYNINIPTSEIGYIYDNLTYRIPKL